MKLNRKLVFVCTGSDCKKCGSKSLYKELKVSIKQPDLKGDVKLIKTKCLDMCKSGPMVIVEDQFLKKSTLRDVLERLKNS